MFPTPLGHSSFSTPAAATALPGGPGGCGVPAGGLRGASRAPAGQELRASLDRAAAGGREEEPGARCCLDALAAGLQSWEQKVQRVSSRSLRRGRGALGVGVAPRRCWCCPGCSGVSPGPPTGLRGSAQLGRNSQEHRLGCSPHRGCCGAAPHLQTPSSTSAPSSAEPMAKAASWSGGAG